MTEKKCDRCGTSYFVYNTAPDERNINGFLTSNINDQRGLHWEHGPYNLCHKCSNELMKWFKEKKENNDA